MELLAFKIVVERDEDHWRSYYPAWEHLGAASCGEDPNEAAINIKKVLEMIVQEIEEGQIEWPVTPSPNWDFSLPSMQDEPELMEANCHPGHPAAVASHGGLPLPSDEANPEYDDPYRLIYVAMDEVMENIHIRRTELLSRTGGLSPKVFALGHLNPKRDVSGIEFGYVSRGRQIRNESVGQPRDDVVH